MSLPMDASWWTIVALFVSILAVVPITLVFRVVPRMRSRDPSLLGLRDELSYRPQVDANARLTIIAIHGLGSNPVTTWSAKDGSTRVHWLKDARFLPKKFPNATILTYNYNADWIYQASPSTPQDTGKELLNEISRWRKKHDDRAPIILIGHSYGGLVAKEAINVAHGNASEHNDYGEIRKAIIGVIFLGTPHHGSATSTMGSYLTRIFSILLGADGYLLRSLERGHPALKSSHRTFVDRCRAHAQSQKSSNDRDFDLWEHSKCFYEKKPTMLICGLISLGMTVDEHSASADHRDPIPLNKDHSGMNKFAAENDSDYIKICNAIRELADSKNPIARRHQLEEQASRIIELIHSKNIKWRYESSPAHLETPVTMTLTGSSIYEGWERSLFLPNADTMPCLRLRLTRDALHVPLVECVLRKLSKSSEEYPLENAIPGICFHSVARNGSGPANRASKVLEDIVAQMILQKLVDLSAADAEDLRGLALELFSVNAENSLPDRYWILLRGLIRLTSGRRVLIVLDRLECVHEEDRVTFVHCLKGLQMRNSMVSFLVSHSPNNFLDSVLEYMGTFDAAKDIKDAFESLKLKAENGHQRNVGRNLLQNTGSWLKLRPQYKELSDIEKSSVLWLNGAAGSGKSSLIKAVLEKFRTTYRSPNLAHMLENEPQGIYHIPRPGSPNELTRDRKTIVASYFYHYHLSDASEMSHQNMLLSILFQIFWQHPDLLISWLKRTKNANINVETWDWEILRSVFEDICLWNKSRLAIYIFVDAINESLPDAVGDKDNPSKNKVVKLLCELGKSSTSWISWKIMAASRDLGIPPLNVQSIQMATYNSEDVGLIVGAKMTEIRVSLRKSVFDDGAYDNALKTFEDRLRHNHGGIILWVKGVAELVKARVEDCTFKLSDLVKLLRDPPPDLENLYTAMVAQLATRTTTMDNKTNNSSQSNIWLRWGILAMVDLSIAEFNDAVAICGFDGTTPSTIETLQQERIYQTEPDKFRKVLALHAGGFLELQQRPIETDDKLEAVVDTMQDSDHKIRVAHESVKRFLTTEPASPFQINAKDGNLSIASMCIKYLELILLNDDHNTRATQDIGKIVQHLEHLPLLPYVLEYLPLHVDRAEQTHGVDSITTDLKTFAAKVQACNSSITSVLLVWLSCQDIASDSTELASRGINQNSASAPVSVLTNGTDRQTVWRDMMRAMNSGPQSHGGDYQQRTESMLREAARLGSPGALKSLLAAGVTRRTATTSQLWLEVIKYANHGIKTDRRLRVAVSNQMHRDFVVLSQTSRRAIGATSTRAVARTDASGNLLLEAIRLTLPPEIITSLTYNNENLCARDPIGLTPLHLAVAGGLTKTAQILIDAGADANARDDSERTPLMHAVLSNEPHTLQLLLEYGADIHARDSHGSTAMAIANAQRDEGLMQWLAYFGAEAVSSRVSAQPQTKGYMTVPVKRNPHYIDRPELMAQIKEGFEDYDTVVLTGLGGTGKTQLAVNYAEQLHDADNLESIFWVDGSSLSHIASSCEYLTQSVCSDKIAKPTKPEDVVKFFMKWLARQHERKWTLVLDNIEEEKIFSMVAHHLRSGTGKGHRMLLTARNSRILGSSEGCSVKVGVFSQEDGLRLIGRYLPETRDNTLAAKLVENLGQHPLAIIQAASYIANTDLSLENYLDLLDGRPSVKDQLLDQEFEQHRGPVQLPNALTKTWAITFDQIQQGDPSNSDVMAFIATLYGEKCPKSLLGEFDPKIKVESALKILQDFHLIETSYEFVSMHSLVRAATRVWLNLHGRARSFQCRALQIMHEVFPSRPSGKTRRDCQQLFPQAQTVLQYDFDEAGDQLLKVKLLYATAMYQMDSSDFDGAEAALKSAKHIASSLLPDRGLRESLSAQSGLTSVYLQQGLLNQAIATEEEVYRAREDAFGIQDPDTIASLVQRGHATRALGKFKEAGALYEKALRIQGKKNHADKEQILTIQAGLAATMVSAGSFKEGSKLQENIVNDRKANLPQHDPQTLAAMNNLAVTLGLLGEFDKSEKLHREVLDVRRDLMGPLHLTTLTSSINLAQVYRAEGRWIEAEELDREVLGDMQRSLGREHTLTLAVMANLALTLRERGVILYDKSRGIVVRNHAQIHEARALATSSFEAYKQMFGTQHPDTLKSQELCASILWYDDEEKRAEREMKDAMSRKQQVLGEDHPDTLSSMAAYASILALGKDGQLLEAKRLDKIVLQGRRNTLGPDHPETLSAEENLAATNSALSVTIPVQPDGQQKKKFLHVVVYHAGVAERFATCMDRLASFDYHELQGHSALKNAALNLSLVRLRLARWSTMVHFRTAGTLNDHRADRNGSHVANSEEETALVNVLTKMHSTLRYVAVQCYQERRSTGNESVKLLPRLMREIDRLSEEKMPTRSPSVGGRISRSNLGPLFRDHGKLRRFIDDMTDFTFSLLHLFPSLPGPQENEYASPDVRALLDWLQTDITSQELEELSPILVQAAREVDPAFKLGMERGRHMFGGHTYNFVKAAGRAKIVMESSLNKEFYSWAATRYENHTASGHVHVNSGPINVRDSRMVGSTTWNNFRSEGLSGGYFRAHTGNNFGYYFND